MASLLHQGVHLGCGQGQRKGVPLPLLCGVTLTGLGISGAMIVGSGPQKGAGPRSGVQPPCCCTTHDRTQHLRMPTLGDQTWQET